MESPRDPLLTQEQAEGAIAAMSLGGFALLCAAFLVCLACRQEACLYLGAVIIGILALLWKLHGEND